MVKPFTDALRYAAANLDREDWQKWDPLKRCARALIAKSMDGETAALKELADRLEGKVPQAITGGTDEDAPLKISALVQFVRDASSPSGN